MKRSKVIVQKAGGNFVNGAKVNLSINDVTPNVYTNRKGIAIVEHESTPL